MPTGQRPNPPQHVAVFSVTGTIDAKYPWANVFWVRNGKQVQPDTAGLTDMCQLIGNSFANSFKNAMSSKTTIEIVRALYYGPTGADVGAEKQIGQAGSGGADVLPANVAMCISWRVQAHYKGGHPRTYLAGIRSEDMGDAASWLPNITSEFAGKANDFNDYVNAISFDDWDDVHLGTVSFVLRKAWRSPPVFRDFVPGAATVDSRIDSQRRRLGRGR